MKNGCAQQYRVDRHFGGSLPPSEEGEMRAHVSECAACSARYEKQLLLAELDPTADRAEDRIARGLGFGKPAARPLRSIAPAAAFAMTAALLLVVGLREIRSPEREFTARGAGEHAIDTVLVYRSTGGEKPARAQGSIHAHDGLAFAYESASAKRYLMIFGVDEHRHVFWYHPAWSNPGDDPSSIAIDQGPGIHHLNEAIAHQLDGRELEIHAVFTDSPLAVKNVERLVTSEPNGSPARATAYAPDALESTLHFSVER